jgi:cell division protein FtsL
MKKTNKKVKLFRIERMLIKICTILLVIFPVTIVLSKAALSNMNLEVEVLKSKINTQKNSNESLTMKVNELKSLANIDVIAENEGLSYNSDNIIVITN